MPGTCETTLQWYNYIFISVKVCAVQMRIQQIILIVDLCFFQTDIPTLSTEWVELLTLHTGSVWGFQSVLPVSHSALCSSLGTGQSEIGCSQYAELCACVQVPAACNVCSCSIFYSISPTITHQIHINNSAFGPWAGLQRRSVSAGSASGILPQINDGTNKWTWGKTCSVVLPSVSESLFPL